MNSSEGLRRIAQVVRWIGLICASITILTGLGGWALQFRNTSINEFFGGAVVIGIGAAFFFYSSRALAWIIDGFAKEK
ncbi:MAG: hypothetical protein Q7T25_16770 [Sideroxyarcus sp.]|nr:hypothetical protein [Sideroxyarcus sp.]